MITAWQQLEMFEDERSDADVLRNLLRDIPDQFDERERRVLRRVIALIEPPAPPIGGAVYDPEP